MPFQKVDKLPKSDISLSVIKTSNIQQCFDFYTPYYNVYVTEDKLRKLGNSDEKLKIFEK